MSKVEIQSAEDLLKKMRAGTKEVHELKFRELRVPVRVLSLDEMNLIRRDAYRTAVANKGDDVDVNVLTQKSTLKLASTLTKGSGPLLSDKLLSMLTVDEINFLYEEYIRVSESVNPKLETIAPEYFRELVNALKKNTITPKDLSLPQLWAICSSYVDLIQRQETRS